jgi:hypothetical protein
MNSIIHRDHALTEVVITQIYFYFSSIALQFLFLPMVGIEVNLLTAFKLGTLFGIAAIVQQYILKIVLSKYVFKTNDGDILLNFKIKMLWLTPFIQIW